MEYFNLGTNVVWQIYEVNSCLRKAKYGRNMYSTSILISMLFEGGPNLKVWYKITL
jgi:hypothetical protein